MLNTPNLDDQRFEEIVEEAVRSIPYVFPEWTDHNASDPGITLLELFAWYKEMQQYHLNVTPERTADMFLKLLGRRRGDIRAAMADVTFSGLCGPVDVREGTRLDGAPFEFARGARLGRARVERLVIAGGGRAADVSELINADHLPLRVGALDTLHIGMSGEAARDGRLEMWLDIHEEDGARPNPFRAGQEPGRRALWTDGTGAPLAVIEDETYALSRTGRVVLALNNNALTDPLGMGEYVWIAMRYEDPGCEELPQVFGVSLNFARLVQRRTLVASRDFTRAGTDIDVEADIALALEGDCLLLARDEHGFYRLPAQKYAGGRVRAAARKPLIQDGLPNVRAVFYEPWAGAFLTADGTGRGGFTWPLSLMGEQPEALSLSVMGSVDTPGGRRYEDWRYCVDPGALGPFEKGFGYDPARGALTFGDNERGEAAPPGGESLLLTGLAVTLGAAGRYPEDTPVFGEGRAYVSRVFAGADRETTRQARDRFIRALAEPCKAVTEADYAALARQTPGLRVAQAGSIAGYHPRYTAREQMTGAVTVIVRPYNGDPFAQPDERFIETVRGYLEEFRPVCSYLYVTGPLYITVNISMRAVSAAPVELLREKLTEAARAALRGQNGDWPLGKPVRESDMIAALGAVSEVLAIPQLTLSSDHAGTGKSPAGDLLLPPHALPMLGTLELYATGR